MDTTALYGLDNKTNPPQVVVVGQATHSELQNLLRGGFATTIQGKVFLHSAPPKKEVDVYLVPSSNAEACAEMFSELGFDTNEETYVVSDLDLINLNVLMGLSDHKSANSLLTEMGNPKGWREWPRDNGYPQIKGFHTTGEHVILYKPQGSTRLVLAWDGIRRQFQFGTAVLDRYWRFSPLSLLAGESVRVWFESCRIQRFVQPTALPGWCYFEYPLMQEVLPLQTADGQPYPQEFQGHYLRSGMDLHIIPEGGAWFTATLPPLEPMLDGDTTDKPKKGYIMPSLDHALVADKGLDLKAQALLQSGSLK